IGCLPSSKISSTLIIILAIPGAMASFLTLSLATFLCSSDKPASRVAKLCAWICSSAESSPAAFCSSDEATSCGGKPCSSPICSSAESSPAAFCSSDEATSCGGNHALRQFARQQKVLLSRFFDILTKLLLV